MSTVNHVASRLFKMGQAHSLLGQRESASVCYELQESLDEAIDGLEASFKAGEDIYWAEVKAFTAVGFQHILHHIDQVAVQNGEEPIFTKKEV